MGDSTMRRLLISFLLLLAPAQGQTRIDEVTANKPVYRGVTLLGAGSKYFSISSSFRIKDVLGVRKRGWQPYVTLGAVSGNPYVSPSQLTYGGLEGHSTAWSVPLGFSVMVIIRGGLGFEWSRLIRQLDSKAELGYLVSGGLRLQRWRVAGELGLELHSLSGTHGPQLSRIFRLGLRTKTLEGTAGLTAVSLVPPSSKCRTSSNTLVTETHIILQHLWKSRRERLDLA